MIASGIEFVFRAIQPAKRPVKRPLIVDAMTIDRITGRTAGVNHADAPSSIPRMAPAMRPRSGFDMFVSPSSIHSTFRRNPLARDEERDDAHDDVGGDECGDGAVVHQPALGELEDVFAV